MISSTKELFSVNDAGCIGLKDLVQVSIVGCTNNIAGFPTPCTKLANIPPTIATDLLEIDNQKIVMAENISLVITDKNFPLILKGEPQG
ncbi:hypothetical protein ACFOPX_06675 [Helicobacter baculiformis]|uniref:Uncharacterized protein n=1 Tax=Helicobacter baculiformis TaxID=427351 RepID=A0ABV7ZHZ8_9HELI|nr:hypothetical protein [Helicobacter baculiformis]